MSGFLFPNEALVEWDLLIVVYPYITGLVAGAFVVSSLYHVFGLEKFKPVARFSLVTALAFLLVCPLPLVIHLGRPERALEMFFRPNLLSAMSAFGFIWMTYLVLVVFEVWLVFRKDIVEFARSAKGFKRRVYRILTLGVYDITEKTLGRDHKIITVLAALGIPAACILHGYVGFIFGAIKANPWWSTSLMPIIFLLSAIVSGIALLTVLYIAVTKLRKAKLEHETVRALGLWLGGFLTLAFTLELLEIYTMMYESGHVWPILQDLITNKIAVSYLGIQFGMGAVLPLMILGTSALGRFSTVVKTRLTAAAAGLVLVGVFAMRWNVVIGGQLISKSFRGLNEYTPPLLGETGILISAALMLLPLVFFALIAFFIPPWDRDIKAPAPKRLSF